MILSDCPVDSSRQAFSVKAGYESGDEGFSVLAKVGEGWFSAVLEEGLCDPWKSRNYGAKRSAAMV
ncbi:hypothetical protein O9992_12255 [Vibrio lentus]|nr:hypothetical protein [Vibrio lentus]